eukprot:1161665-Pelagomonas_calceolata.AAC.7
MSWGGSRSCAGMKGSCPCAFCFARWLKHKSDTTARTLSSAHAEHRLLGGPFHTCIYVVGHYDKHLRDRPINRNYSALFGCASLASIPCFLFKSLLLWSCKRVPVPDLPQTLFSCVNLLSKGHVAQAHAAPLITACEKKEEG